KRHEQHRLLTVQQRLYRVGGMVEVAGAVGGGGADEQEVTGHGGYGSDRSGNRVWGIASGVLSRWDQRDLWPDRPIQGLRSTRITYTWQKNFPRLATLADVFVCYHRTS